MHILCQINSNKIHYFLSLNENILSFIKENEVQQFEGEFFGKGFENTFPDSTQPGSAFLDSTQHGAAFPDSTQHGAAFPDSTQHGPAFPDSTSTYVDPDAETVVFEPKFVPAGTQGSGGSHFGNKRNRFQPTAVSHVESKTTLSPKENFDQIYNSQAKSRPSSRPTLRPRTSTTPAAASIISTTTDASRIPKIFTANPKVLDPFTDSYTEVMFKTFCTNN